MKLRRLPITTSRLAQTGAAIVLGLAIGAPLQSHAQPAPAEPTSHAGRKGEPRLPELALQAQAVSEVAQDTVTITLATELEAADQASVGKRLTAALDAAMKQAQGDDKVKARNGNYRIWANTNRDGKVTGWRGRVELVLESKDFQAASALAGKLSGSMPVAGITFSLSDQARAEEERKLLEQAATAFRERALAAASAFGFNGYRIRKIELSGSGAQYTPRAGRMQAMAANGEAMKLADVPLQGDTETVVVSVNGTVSLQ